MKRLTGWRRQKTICGRGVVDFGRLAIVTESEVAIAVAAAVIVAAIVLVLAVVAVVAAAAAVEHQEQECLGLALHQVTC